jgi:hypothetical protein
MLALQARSWDRVPLQAQWIMPLRTQGVLLLRLLRLRLRLPLLLPAPVPLACSI